MTTLSAEEIRTFQSDGYLVVDCGVPESVLDSIVADLDGNYPDGLNQDGVQPPTRIQDAWKTHAGCHQLAMSEHLLQCLRELYGREPKPFQTLNFPTGTWQPAHADSVHFNSLPLTFMAGVWVALEDCDEDNGPIEYWPGSHQLPEFNMADVGVEPLEENYAHYEKFIAKVIERFELKSKLALVKKGQAFIWASNLIHAGGARKDLYRTRHSQVTHVFFEGCKYWTPMKSQGLEVCWREPQFIPAPEAKKKGLFRR
ncbi:MAG: hypothetical protein ACI8QZ_001587 [Chlamydiales bacterium]|jgi:hypothetical protein